MLEVKIPDEARTDFDAGHEYFALIVLDEMGSQPHFVRALCALHAKRVCETLADYLKVREVRIVVGGGLGASAQISNLDRRTLRARSFMPRRICGRILQTRNHFWRRTLI
jgi:hypothetical protein